MALVSGFHAGPWTEEDLIALPEGAQRHELLEGTLLVNPPPAAIHQLVSWNLTGLLRGAAPPNLAVVEALGVRLLDNTVFLPDVVVAWRDVVLNDRSGILNSRTVVLVAEIVSPRSRIADRVTKPAVYARCGIASFWRVELEDGPSVFAYRLEEGRYVEAGSARPGERLVADQPFQITFDPDVLRP